MRSLLRVTKQKFRASQIESPNLTQIIWEYFHGISMEWPVNRLLTRASCGSKTCEIISPSTDRLFEFQTKASEI